MRQGWGIAPGQRAERPTIEYWIMRLTNQGMAFLPKGGALPRGPYPVFPELDIAQDGAVTGEVHFAGEPKYPRPISIGTDFDVHIPHPDSITGENVILTIRFVDNSGSVTGYVHGSHAQFHLPTNRRDSTGSRPVVSTAHRQESVVDTVPPDRKREERPEGRQASFLTSRQALILTALRIEYKAVRAFLTEMREETHPCGTVYERGKLRDSIGNVWDVALVEIGAGNVNAGVEAERAIAHFDPSVAFFVGVAGGLKDVAIGDVVVATKIYMYESGKAHDSFEPRPDVAQSSYRLEQRARAEAKREDWLKRLGDVNLANPPNVHVGAIAAGEKVVASTGSTTYQLLRSTYGDALAVEMEGRGFLQAIRARSRVEALVIRGISDLIDKKSDADARGFQEVAARHAGAFAFEVLSKLMAGEVAGDEDETGPVSTPDHESTFPRIDNVRILGTTEDPRAEIRGVNLVGADVAVTADSMAATIVRNEPTVLEILLPRGFFGNVAIRVDGKSSNSVFCDASYLGKRPNHHHKVIAAELPLYSDAKALTKRQGVVGLLLRSTDTSREFITIVPTYPSRYKAGCYVTHGPHIPGTSVGETWYIDPTSGKIEYAWTGSMMMAPTTIGPVGNFKLGGISILPNTVHTQLGENRCLRVTSWGRDGSIQEDSDVTDRVKWKNIDASVAAVRDGVLFQRNWDGYEPNASWTGTLAPFEISVEHLLRGQQTTYFQGLRQLQQIRFDNEDNLYICNQGPSVFRLDRTGVFSEILRISSSPRAAAGIDCLAVDVHKNLYVNDVSKQAAFKFSWDGRKYVNPIEVAAAVTGAKKGFAVMDSGDVFVAVMGSPSRGWIVRREVNGKETVFPVRGTPIWLAAGTDGNIYVPFADTATVVAYRPDGTVAEEIPYNIKDSSVCDILVDKDSVIYMPLFHTGRVLRIGFGGVLWQAEFLPQTFGTPGGIAMDSHGRLYVSDFTGNSIDVVY